MVAYTGTALGLPVFLRFLEEAGLRRANFAGSEIPLGAGLYPLFILPAFIAAALMAGVKGFTMELSLVFLFAVSGFGLAGLVDDCLGSAAHKGFRGHFGALFREGRLTSGAIKALAGAAVGLMTALVLPLLDRRAFGSWYQVALNALLLASAANSINLFDLRPGRAGKVFFLGMALCAAFATRIERFGAPLLLLVVVFLPLLRMDLRARLMLGDTGANMLGATLGLAMALWLTPHAKVVAAILLLLLQILSERFSFSALIDRVGFLRALDRLGRRAEE